MGTYNTLSYFGLSYIEQIAIYDRDLFEQAAQYPYSLHYTFKRDQERQGFSRIALRTKILRKRVGACEHWAMKYMGQMHVAEQDQMAQW